MLGGQTTLVTVADESQVGEARRAVTVACHRLGLDETVAGKAAVVATEAATNIVKHAARGEILVRAVPGGIEVMALDRGPGIGDIAASLRDGYSTSGTQGSGLGAIRRMATTFDIYSALGLGTAIVARLLSPAATASLPAASGNRLVISAVSLPVAGETLNGDAWAEERLDHGLRILLVDGLGHGPVANEAAHAAVEAFQSAPGEAPSTAVETCHLAMRSTRGAALAVAEISVHPGVVRFAGIGNVAGSIWNGSVSHHTVSLNGTAGHGTIRPREFSYPWPAGGLLVMASDGLATRWSLENYPGLASHDPALVAGVLYRDHSRGRDDVTVVVAGEAKR
jgi:anti-sigma regulatory factor (Ser/Thr protein kinase)